MSDILRKTFGDEKRWVNWKYKIIGGKKTKIPYSISGVPASSTDAFTWATYEEALHASKDIGIVFTPAQDLLGIDIDKCLDKDGVIIHEAKETIAQFLIEADTYTEISPSGTGLHLFLKIQGALPLSSNKKAPFEIYTSGRYFTVTNIPYKEEREVRTVTPKEALELLSIIGYPWNQLAHSNEPAQKVSSFSDNELLSKMFTSKNGPDIKNLYDGKGPEDESSADMALCSHLAFWTGGDASQMERIWLASPLGMREKTQSRKDYRDRTISKAISSCKQFYTPPAARPSDDQEIIDLDLLYTEKGKERIKVYTLNMENICRILRKHPYFSHRFRFDNFKNRVEVKKGDEWVAFEDSDVLHVQADISIIFDFFRNVGKEMVFDAIVKVSRENAIDSAMDYIRHIKWDGESRLATWLHHVYGAPKDSYHEAVGSNWLKGLVKRICEPGCKFDYVLVLEGPQGTKKSTSLAILGGDWHLETVMGTESKDFFEQFQGKAIIEFSEGETMSRTEVKRMKAIITMQRDKYRPAYGRVSKDFPRRCVFAMTTNQAEYLKDETGNRRWLPVEVVASMSNLEWLIQNRDQLFAEAYERVITRKETVWEFPEEETKAMQRSRRISDPNEEKICEWYETQVKEADKMLGISIDRVYKEALHGNSPFLKPMNNSEEMSIASILKEVMGLEKRRLTQRKLRKTLWFPKDAPRITDLPTSEIEEEMIEATKNF